MPRYQSIASSEKSWFSLHAKGIATLLVTIFLCLPSLVGAAALLINQLLYRRMEDWRQTSCALIALAVFIGAPLIAVAAIVGGITAFSRSVSLRIKYAHLFLVGLATIAILSLLLRFTGG